MVMCAEAVIPKKEIVAVYYEETDDANITPPST